MDEEVRRSKELFVTNLNGTTWVEVDSIQLIQPLCIFLFSSILCFIFHGARMQAIREKNSPPNNAFLYITDFTLCVLPLLAALTVFSEYMLALVQILIVIMVLLLATTCTNFNQLSLSVIWNATIDSSDKAFISWYRAYVNVLTAICILAVDFKLYPRRLAKSETFGTGLMDIFVGAFIMCNSLVCKEATDRKMEFRGLSEKLTSLRRVLWSSLPLTVLGVARLVSTKSSNYQEHVTEYGVHWNFFMTLAAVRVLCTLMFCLIKPSKSVLLSISFAVTYQYLLSHKLQDYILRDGGRADNWISANREGVFSLFGYMSLYFAGVTVGRIIFHKTRLTFGANAKLCLQLLVLSGISLLGMILAENNGIRVSRRMANLTFVLWTIHHSLLLLGGMLAISLLQHLIDVLFTVNMSTYKSFILEAVNYNGLLYFLLANLLTGAVNLAINTLQCSPGLTFTILSSYLFILNSAIYILYQNSIRVKFW